MAETSMDRSSEKRRRILEAARFLILRDGLRATTMQAIAREAGIAKPTLYAQFPDKDAVFAGIVAAIMDEIAIAVDAGLAGPGNAAQRVGAALAGQYQVLLLALDGSPHAGELMSEHKRAGLAFREQDIQFKGRIAGTLRAAGVAEPDALALLVIHAAYGIAFKTSAPDAVGPAIRLLCERLITPDLP